MSKKINEYGEACADTIELDQAYEEAKARGEIKETTSEEFHEIAKRVAIGYVETAFEEIGVRISKKRREEARKAIHNARAKLIRDADTTAPEIRAAIKVLTIAENGGPQDEATAVKFIQFKDWSDVPQVLLALLNRLGYPVEV